ncbi:MAG: HIT family protein [Clostridia bacterium]|nr:HIT family protein [Clostridia bacterium]
MENCLFCKIINGEIPSYKIYENDYVYAFLDIANDYFGHTLVIPKKHFENVFDCEDDYLSEIIKAVKLISNHYKNLGFSGVNVINASGKDAEQSVFHLHFHILPRKENDGNKIWPTKEKKDFDLAKICDELKIKEN